MATNEHGAPGIRRIGHVDDHPTVGVGLAAVLADQPDLELVATAATVPALLEQTTELDLAVLDIRLADGSTPVANVELLRSNGIETLVYTSGEDLFLVRAAARAGVLGVLLKSADVEATIAAVRAAAHGQQVVTMDWAAAIDGDPDLPAVGLTPRQREVLALYASGEKAATVAHRTGLSELTVNDYLSRIRRRYAEAGRPAPTKTDLYKRALEDGWLPLPRRNR